MTTTAPSTSATPRLTLPRLYLARFAFAIIWAALLFPTSASTGPFLTALLFAYPLVDAAAVLWQLRSGQGERMARLSQWTNVVVSVVVAVAVAVASTSSLSATLAIWGVWAIGSGLPQLVTAIRNRGTGGQIPQMMSGAISVLAGASFVANGLGDADSLASVGGYAILGGLFFGASAIRLISLERKAN